MRETIGNTFIIKLVIVFTLLFSAFLALAISYNKVFRMKNEVLSIIEKYEGINEKEEGYTILMIQGFEVWSVLLSIHF